MTVLGWCGVGVLAWGPIIFGGVGLSLHWMLIFMLVALLGLNFFFAGIFARLLYDLQGKLAEKFSRKFNLDRISLLCFLLLTAGAGFQLPLLSIYIREGYKLPAGIGLETYQFIAGICLEMSSFIMFTGTLVVQAIVARLKRNIL